MASISLKYKSKQGNLTAPGDVDPGAIIPIATTTLSTSTATITFSNIPQNYEHLQIRLFGRQTGAASMPSASIKPNSATGSVYAWHNIYGSGASAATQNSTTTGTMQIFQGIAAANATASVFSAAILDILDYANTNKYKTFRCLSGADLNGSGEIHFTSGLWMDTSAITQLDINSGSTSFAQYTHAALYGIKRAGA